MKSPGPKYTMSSWSIRGVPRIIRRNTFVTPEINLFLDILPYAMGNASGIENKSVRKKTSSETPEPLSMARSIFINLGDILKVYQKFGVC